MTNELWKCLLSLTTASSIAVAAVLLTRLGVRRAFGTSASYWVWLFVPMAKLAAILPNGATEDRVVSSIASVTALRHVIGGSSAHAFVAPSSAGWMTSMLGVWVVGVILSIAYMVRLQRAFMSSLGPLSGSARVLHAQSSAGCPVLVGIFKPSVILPRDFKSRYTSKERLLIIAHERVHMNRGDCLCNFTVALCRCVFWFNPLIHIGANVLRRDQELACDAAVIRRYPSSRRAYANAMLKTQLADAALPGGCHWRCVDPLEERLEMLKLAAESTLRRFLGRVFVAIAALAVGCCVLAAEVSANGWLETNLPTADVAISASFVNISKDGESQFEQVEMDFGPPAVGLHITADHAHATGRLAAESTGKPTLVFEGHVVVHRGDRWYQMNELSVRWTPEGVWLDPNGLESLAGAPTPLLERVRGE